MRNLQLLIQHDQAQIAGCHLLHEGDTHVVEAFLGGKSLSFCAFNPLAGLTPDIQLPGSTQAASCGNGGFIRRCNGGGRTGTLAALGQIPQ